jgi:phenylpropionate dioxygenase-like ring-hydroxylating dioxygenase large terminal subunit
MCVAQKGEIVMSFIRNAWYVANWAHDLQDEPLAQTILGENVVLWRGADGDVRAAEDVCPHRATICSAATTA